MLWGKTGTRGWWEEGRPKIWGRAAHGESGREAVCWMRLPLLLLRRHFPFLALCVLCYVTRTFNKMFPGSNIRYCFYIRGRWSSGRIRKAGYECIVIWSWIFLFSSEGAFGMLNSDRGRAAIGFRSLQLWVGKRCLSFSPKTWDLHAWCLPGCPTFNLKTQSNWCPEIQTTHRYVTIRNDYT